METEKQTSNRILSYKGYQIWRNVKTVYFRNPVSGHEYSKNMPVRGFYVGGGRGISVEEIFRSVQKAKDKIDFVLKYSWAYDIVPLTKN